MVILVVFNSFNVVKNLKKPDLVACEKPPFYTTCVDCESYLDYMITKEEKLVFRCFSCKKNYEKDFNKELIRRFWKYLQILQ